MPPSPEDPPGTADRSPPPEPGQTVASGPFPPPSEVTAAYHLHQPIAAGDAPAAREPGTPIVPGYEILGVLGRGGMGVVYRARQTALKRLVALKMVLAGSHAGPEQRARFKSEAEAVARLQH